MKRLLKSPAFNAVCIGLFTAFYALMFFLPPGSGVLEGHAYGTFWPVWRGFLAAGHQRYIACVLIAVTALIIFLLIKRRQPHDEYHTSILTHCLAAAAMLTLVAIAIFYLMILRDPSGIAEKFTLFVSIHWTTVVFANLAYVLLCRWR